MLTLAFDTAGPWCRAAVVNEGAAYTWEEELRSGQSERLMPFLQDCLTSLRAQWRDVRRIGVGVGPGNFTGIRASVSAARGLALGLRVPAFGVTGFEALGRGAPRDALCAIAAPRDQIYLGGAVHGARLVRFDDIGPIATSCVIGHRHVEIAQRLGVPARDAAAPEIEAIARIAAEATKDRGQPKPFYFRPPDAAPPRIEAPRILDDA